MYTLPSKLKLFAIVFMVLGAIGIATGFMSTPSNTAEVKEMIQQLFPDKGERRLPEIDDLDDDEEDEE